jgi:hypothetical protein
MASIGQGQNTRGVEHREEMCMVHGAERNLSMMHDEADLMDDLAQYLMTTRGNNPFRTPPQTPLNADIDMGPSPPLSPMDNSPESLRGCRRERRSQMKSLQILGPEACGAVVDQWKKGRAA